MLKYILIGLCLIQIFVAGAFCQTKCETCFIGLEDHLDLEYQAILNANKAGGWITENELRNLKYLKDQYYKPNVLAYLLLTEQNWPSSDDSFELIYFSIYQYEFPAYSWAICVYKHLNFDMYNVVTLDVDGAFSDRIGSLMNSRFFSEFHEELVEKFAIDANYQSGYDLNFSGFAVFFESQKIEEVRILHDSRYLRNLTLAVSRVR